MILAQSEKRKVDMDEFQSHSIDRWQICMTHRYSQDRIQYLLKTEAQILRSISARAPITKILNEICNALDCQIGNLVSLISVPGDDAINTDDIARNAALFGLYIFFSVGIGSESGGQLGSLQMYCCVSRAPSPREFQLIERAACLAAVAIKRSWETGDDRNSRMHGNRRVFEYVPAWPTSMN